GEGAPLPPPPLGDRPTPASDAGDCLCSSPSEGPEAGEAELGLPGRGGMRGGVTAACESSGRSAIGSSPPPPSSPFWSSCEVGEAGTVYTGYIYIYFTTINTNRFYWYNLNKVSIKSQ